MVSAGRILILPQGTWDNATMYNMLDLVAYNGISWLCKRQCVGITPSVSATEYWQQFGSSAPIASTTVAGLVMPDGQTITINTTTGAIAVPTASVQGLGLVKPDGTSITINANGVISSAGGNLSNLGDVAITSLANGQVLIWNQTNQKWQNGTIAGALSQLSDVTITSATDEQILVYDSTAQKWKNATAQATLSNSTKPVQTAVVKKALTDVVETVGAGASQAYSEGDIILGNDGTYYKATTDIAQNTTLTVGGNIEATNNRALITNLTHNLTADNGQVFKYGYDSTSGKYGYYTESGGADTFHPFNLLDFGLPDDTLFWIDNISTPVSLASITGWASSDFCVVHNATYDNMGTYMSSGSLNLDSLAITKGGALEKVTIPFRSSSSFVTISNYEYIIVPYLTNKQIWFTKNS